MEYISSSNIRDVFLDGNPNLQARNSSSSKYCSYLHLLKGKYFHVSL